MYTDRSWQSLRVRVAQLNAYGRDGFYPRAQRAESAISGGREGWFAPGSEGPERAGGGLRNSRHHPRQVSPENAVEMESGGCVRR